MQAKEPFNPLVTFLIGKWHNVSFEIANGKEVKKESYPETMTAKSKHTLTITAHGFKNGKDLTKDMTLEVSGKSVIMSQGSFRAEGTVEGNVYYLKGSHNNNEFRFRLYTMGDKYVFHRETWKGGLIQQIDMSYLTRK